MGCGRGCRRPRRALDLEEVRQVMPGLLQSLAEVSDLGGKTGCMLSILDRETRELVTDPIMVGVVADKERQDRYSDLSQEKATRLLDNPDHSLSWQSRDEDNDKWGGAMDDGEYNWSVSGLTEEQDEALAIMGAHKCGQITNGSPQWYAKISDNEIILGNPYLFWMIDDQPAEPNGEPIVEPPDE